MDDFLHNLRSGKLKQPDRGRRDYTDYKGPQRRVGNDRRRPDYYAKVTNENFAQIKDTLDALIDNQKRLTDVMAARKKTETRIADALDAMVMMMARRWGYEDVIAQRPEANDVDTAADQAGGASPAEYMDRHANASAVDESLNDDRTPELMDIITAMRNDGDSWEKIARYFDDQGIPTVSGKGKWRGTGIKKLWEMNTESE